MSTKTTKSSKPKSTAPGRAKKARPANGSPAKGKPELVAYEGDLEVTPVGPADFEPEELRRVLRTMMLSRRLDEKMLTLLRQGRGFFHIGGSGHEAAQLGLGLHLRGGHDWFCFYYRDLAMSLTLGMTARDTMLAHLAKADDPSSGGRQMSEHFGHRELNIMTTSSSVGAQFMPGVGFAFAAQRRGPAEDGLPVTYISGGDGSTSQGAFHEALNWSARAKAPALFHIQDNKYAISVPIHEQTAGANVYAITAGYEGLARAAYDGTDFFTAYAVGKAAVEHIRAGKGPVVLVADVVRLLPHSSSDDHARYRTPEELEADRQRCPIERLSRQLLEAGVMTEADIEALREEVVREADEAADWAMQQPDPAPETATLHNVDENPPALEYGKTGTEGELVVMVDAINHALAEEMERDERVIVYGEDVGGGKGGVFTATRGLTERFGAERCFNSPLAEHSIVGSAVGLAAAGFRPVVEIQFADYIWPAMQQIRNQLAPFRYRSNNAWQAPVVIRVPCGGYIHGGLCHSQNIEGIFAHFPGLKVAMPSNAADAKGMLKTAIRQTDPVLFLEHKALYRQGPARSPEPGADYLVPFGKANTLREGTDLTIVTYGAMVYKAMNIAKQIEREDGASVEVIDIRSMLPLDSEAILESVKKTNRVLVLYEDHEFMGFGAEIAAQITDRAFEHLDAPVKRVAGAFSWIPFADPLERAVLPQDEDVLRGAREVLAY